VAVAALRRDAHALNPIEYVSRLSGPGGRSMVVRVRAFLKLMDGG